MNQKGERDAARKKRTIDRPSQRGGRFWSTSLLSAGGGSISKKCDPKFTTLPDLMLILEFKVPPLDPKRKITFEIRIQNPLSLSWPITILGGEKWSCANIKLFRKWTTKTSLPEKSLESHNEHWRGLHKEMWLDFMKHTTSDI